jgi:prolyl-tRNA synthetase
MTHGDDDGLILPPRLAPAHVVILPIFRNDEEKTTVMDFCKKLEADLKSQTYEGEPVRVTMDTRDLRGGDKVWQHIKRGVPLRAEIGPRDVAGDSVFLARRDKPGEKSGVPRGQFVAEIGKTLTDMQANLFQRALAYREANTRKIDNADEFKAWFTPKSAEQPEIHGGFALCHVAESPEVEKILGDLKVTIRCLPVEGALAGCDPEPGKCIFTGQPSQRRAVLAKAY